MNLVLREFDLPLKHTFTISRESVSIQKTLVVELSDGTHSGYGEATTNRYYGATVESMSQALESVRAELARVELGDPGELWQRLSGRLRDQPFAQCALDQAAHDLWGKQKGKPVYQLWGLSLDRVPDSCFTIGIDEIDMMIAKLREEPGWPVYKIKLGTPNDVEVITRLREHTDAAFRVDANCGWTVDETLRNARELKPLGVEFIEQPLPADQWDGQRRLINDCELPILADESCCTVDDVQRCHEHFHGINIKLVKCGGLTPARQMIADARSLDLKIMVGCMTESTVGISAIAQLLPLIDYVDMDGAALLAHDIAIGVSVEKGVCRFPDRNGSGVELL